MEEQQSPDGKSTEVLINTDFSLAVQKEKSIELLKNMLNSIATGEDIVPFVIGVKHGLPIALECKVNEDGSISLPEMKITTRQELKQKTRTVNKILKQIAPVLRAQIEGVTYVALMRKDVDKLNKIMHALREGKSVKIKNNAGCIFLVIDEDFEICL